MSGTCFGDFFMPIPSLNNFTIHMAWVMVNFGNPPQNLPIQTVCECSLTFPKSRVMTGRGRSRLKLNMSLSTSLLDHESSLQNLT